MRKMKEFIQNCKYFTFNIFKNANIEALRYYFENSDRIYKFTEISDFDLSEHPKEQYYNAPRKIYLFSPLTNENQVVMITNAQDGLNALTRHISSKLGIFSYNFSMSSKEDEEPKNELLLIENGKIKRVIQAMKDEKWVFYQAGAMLDFENPDHYKKRVVKDRLNKEILIQYAQKIGFDVLNNDFWRSKKALLVDFI